MMRKKAKQVKICPLLDRECLKQGCEIYSETLDRCEIGLLAYNSYRLSEAIKKLDEKTL